MLRARAALAKTSGPGARSSSPLRAAPSLLVDLDFRRSDLGFLLDRHFEHAVFVSGLDILVACILWQLERPANRSVTALAQMGLDLLGPFGPLTLRRDR